MSFVIVNIVVELVEVELEEYALTNNLNLDQKTNVPARNRQKVPFIFWLFVCRFAEFGTLPLYKENDNY